MTALLVLLGSLAAAQPSTTTAVSPERTFVHLTTRGWETLDPHNAFDAVSFILTGNIYEPLIIFKSVRDLDGFEPFLAERVPSRRNGGLSADGRTYVFPIRKGVRFHDGSPLTADDVRYSLLRFMLTDSAGGPAALLLKPILGIYSTRDEQGKPIEFQRAAKAVELRGDAVVVHLSQPDAAFLKLVASLPIIVSRSWARAHGEWDGEEATWLKFNRRRPDESYFHDHTNGTGPFAAVSAERGAGLVVLSRNEGYWRKPAALERVIFRVEPNEGQRLFMMETRDADAGYFENSARAAILGTPNLGVIDKTPFESVGTLILFNLQVSTQGNERLGSATLDGGGVPPDFFSDPDVRRGFAAAFDYHKFLDAALDGRGKRTAGPFPPDLLPAAENVDTQTDAARARALLRRAYDGRLWDKGFVLPVSFSSDNAGRRIAAETLKESIEALNSKFKIVLDPVPSGHFYPELEARKLPLFVASHYADYPDPQTYAFGLLHSRGYYPSYQSYSNPKLDALVEQASVEADPGKRRQLFVDMAILAVGEAPQIYTYSPADFRVCGQWVRGCDSDQNVANLGYNGFPYFYAFSKPPARP